jgi:hypothetical protein
MAISEADVHASLRALIDPTPAAICSDKAIRKADRRRQCGCRRRARLPAKSQLRHPPLIQRHLSALPGVGKSL